MNKKSLYISLILQLLLSVTALHAQEKRTELFIDFRVNKTAIDLDFNDNRERIDEIISTIRDINANNDVKILELHFTGAASPEGSYQLNRELARKRLLSLEKFIRERVEIPDSIIVYNDSYIPWDSLKTLVTKSDIPNKGEILSIIEKESEIVDYRYGQKIDSRIIELQKLDDGRTWKTMNEIFFSKLRNACVIFVTFELSHPDVAKEFPRMEKPELEPYPVNPIPLDIPAVEWTPRLHIKTNAIAWGMFISNIAVEADLARHWSVTLPIYYSALNYFTSTVKFRTLSFQPEARYWFNGDNTGLFAGVHFGLSWYNVAVNSSKRVQDHNGNSPAIGGGLAVGYRMPLSKNRRWNVEFTIGAGAYSQHYDEFINEPNGLEIRERKGAYIGIDQAAVTFSYSFNLNKKGGRK